VPMISSLDPRILTHPFCSVEFAAHNRYLQEKEISMHDLLWLVVILTPTSSHNRSAFILAIRSSTSSKSASPAQGGTIILHYFPDTQALRMEHVRGISSFDSRSQAAIPSFANTLRLGLRPTGSRLATLLARKTRRKRTRGCVIWRNKGEPD